MYLKRHRKERVDRGRGQGFGRDIKTKHKDENNSSPGLGIQLSVLVDYDVIGALMRGSMRTRGSSFLVT